MSSPPTHFTSVYAYINPSRPEGDQLDGAVICTRASSYEAAMQKTRIQVVIDIASRGIFLATEDIVHVVTLPHTLTEGRLGQEGKIVLRN